MLKYLAICMLATLGVSQLVSADVYFGYRNSSLKSQTAGTTKKAIAVLHACLNNGYSDVGADWDTCYNTQCASETINVACDPTTCQAGCNALFLN